MDMPAMETLDISESVRLILRLNLMLMPTLLARSIMDSHFTMPPLLAIPTMLESLLALTMDMDVFPATMPLETVGMLDIDIMDTQAMELMDFMESVKLKQLPNLKLMLKLLARFTMDSQFTMPMLLATPIMLESLLELTMGMDVFRIWCHRKSKK
jgi:hypothetical protein